jgi:ribosomal protein S18 acetylase RimI-like enzyme
MPDAYLAGLDEARFSRGWESALDGDATDVGMTLVGINDEGVVDGFVSIGDSGAENEFATGEVRALNLHPEAFGSGLASLLHGAALAALAAAGHRAALLWVAGDNPRARHFYEREGWHADGGTKDDVFGGDTVAEVRYVRDIAK